MRILIAYYVKWLVTATSNDYTTSLNAMLKIALPLSPILYITERLFNWYFDNQDYIVIVLGAILIDYVFGTIKHIWFSKDENGKHTFTLKGNAGGLILKLGLATAGGFLFEGLSHLTREVTIIETSLSIITRIIVFMYPAISAWENIYIVSGEKFPPKKWMEKLGMYKNTADLNDLLGKENLKEE